MSALDINYVHPDCVYCGNEVIKRYTESRKQWRHRRACSRACSLKRKPIYKKPIEQANARPVYRTYKKSAADRGLEFELSLEQFISLALSDCYYCGSKPSNVIL